MWYLCTDPACDDETPHGYSMCDVMGTYEACPAHLICVDPDCAYRRIHLDRIDPLSNGE
jgi:hypothetical protein